jgi:two-component system LytT family response regulator
MIKAIIVDDEFHGRQMLANMLQHFFPSRINVMTLCESVAEGVAAIEKHKPDVVFLDIEMPDGSGFDLIEKSGKHLFLVVFVTAFSEYAVKAFKVNALEYLLKPVQREELSATIDKLDQKLLEGIGNWKDEVLKKLISLTKHEVPKIGLPTMNGHVFINIEEIIYCEADSNYTIVYFANKNMIVSRTLRELEEELKAYPFFRVHKSYLINLNKIVKYSKTDGGTVVLTNNASVPVGGKMKDDLTKMLHLL